MTIRDQLARALLARGYVEVPRSSRYAVFQHPTVTPRTVYLGSRGSLRVGQTYRVSRPWEWFKKQLLAETEDQP